MVDKTSSERLAGKVALVTGGAGGIGAEIADALRGDGAAVMVLDISPTVEERYDAPDAAGRVCDVTDSEALEAAIEELSRLSYGLTEKLYAALGGMDEDLDEVTTCVVTASRTTSTRTC